MAPPSVQSAGHHQSFSPTTQRHHPSPTLGATHNSFSPLFHPQFFSPTTLLTPGFLPHEFPRLLPKFGPSVAEGVTAFSVVIIGHLASPGPSL
nr:hypothetical protein CFP56_56764 [Quercus suber]